MTAAVDEAPRSWRDAFTREEVAALGGTNNWRSWCSVALDWGVVAAAMAVVARWPNAITIVLAIALIGARQYGLGVLMHEAAHGKLFRNRALNDWVGDWLCAAPIWFDYGSYRNRHLEHHANTETREAKARRTAKPSSAAKKKLLRNIWRDLSGRTAWKRVRSTRFGWRDVAHVAVTNLVLFGSLLALGQPALYLLWVVAWCTVYGLVNRIHLLANHSPQPVTTDELESTRTTLANAWERLFVAPNRANYHLEHHLLTTAPLYSLPLFHRMLRERGVVDGSHLTRGYVAVLREAAAKAP
jgi:fatty acid desaturase